MSDPDERQEADRLRTLLRTGLLGSTDYPDLQEICQRAKTQFGVTMAMVTLIAENLLLVKARAGTDLVEAPRVGQFCDYTIRSDDVFVVPDATQDARFADNPVVTGEPHVRSYAGAPLIYRKDIRLGALCLLHTQPRGFTLGDKAELEAMAEEIVIAIGEREMDSGTYGAGLRRGPSA